MSKQKKTRKQKIIADLHRKLQTVQKQAPSSKTETSLPYTHTLIKKSYTFTPTAHTSSITTEYIFSDIRKTIMLTLTLVLAQLALFFLLKNNILALPSLTY